MIKQVLRKSLHTVKEHIDKSNFQKNLIFSLVIFPFLFVPYIIIDILVHLSNNQEYFKLLSSTYIFNVLCNSNKFIRYTFYTFNI